MDKLLQKATFGGGCFWCLEEVFKELKGVEKVTSGYAGGDLPNPTYEQVSSGSTGHAEVVQIEYGPNVINYETLLEVFFATHDPTQLNRQGHDIGTQYRSIILIHSSDQAEKAKEFIKKLAEDKIWPSPIVTSIEPFSSFYPAENYHQDYYEQNSSAPYCQVVINPKLQKFREKYKMILKNNP